MILHIFNPSKSNFFCQIWVASFLEELINSSRHVFGGIEFIIYQFLQGRFRNLEGLKLCKYISTYFAPFLLLLWQHFDYIFKYWQTSWWFCSVLIHKNSVKCHVSKYFLNNLSIFLFSFECRLKVKTADLQLSIALSYWAAAFGKTDTQLQPGVNWVHMSIP